MIPEYAQRLKACLQEAAEILYHYTSADEKITFEAIEKSLRNHWLEQIGPVMAFCFIRQATGTDKGRERHINSCVGKVAVTEKQASLLGLKAYTQVSPVIEKICLRLSANESYQNAEQDIEAMTGVKVSHSTMQRLVHRQEFTLPDAKQPVSEVCLDGGKVRLRGDSEQKSYWRDYKAVRLQGIYYGAAFQNNLELIDWINSQKLTNPFTCLGDGHDGIWKLFKEIGSASQRQEILDWYHLKENLYKVGGSLKRLKKAENLLWEGKVDATIDLFTECRRQQAKNFCAYLEKHRLRIVNYKFLQSSQLASIGSGSVESAVKQIDRRMKISGSQWKLENVNRALQLRCNYLNGQLAM